MGLLSNRSCSMRYWSEVKSPVGQSLPSLFFARSPPHSSDDEADSFVAYPFSNVEKQVLREKEGTGHSVPSYKRRDVCTGQRGQ